MKKIIIPIIFIVVIAVVGVAWWKFGQKQEKSETLKTSGQTIKLAVNVWPGYAYVFVAKEKGFFEKNGVNVEFILEEDYSRHLQHYDNGEVDGIFEVLSDMISQNISNKSAIAVYAVDYSDEGDVIVGKVGSLGELKGKKVGVDGINSFSHIFVQTALEQAGVISSDVEFVNTSASEVLEALESGKIDAGHTWEPTKSATLKKGYKQLGKAGDYPGLVTDILAFNPKLISERPEDVQAIVKSLIEAREFLFSHKDEAIEIMAKAEGMNKEDITSGIDGVHLLDLRDNRTAFSYAAGFESLHGVARRINDFMISKGITNKKLDSTEFIDAQFIRAIK